MTVLVTGGTGTVGSAVVKGLASLGQQVRLLTRSPEKLKSLPTGVKTLQGDLANLASSDRGLQGLDKMVLITPLGQTEAGDGIAAVHAAARAGIKHVVFMSVHRAEEGPHIPHFKSKIEIQKAIERSGIAFTFIKPNNFFQNDLNFRQPILEHGIYPQPLGSIGCSRVDIRDIAEAIVTAIATPGHEGRSYSLVGMDVLNGDRSALAYSNYLKREVRYSGDDLEKWSAQARQMLPDWMVKDLRTMYAFFMDRGLVATREELADQANILGHPPRRFDDFVAETVRSWTTKEMGSGR